MSTAVTIAPSSLAETSKAASARAAAGSLKGKQRADWDVLKSGFAGGIAGCVAKTAIAPLDRVKILFQTSNAEFAQYAGTPRGLVGATGHIYRTTGIRGLFQGHSATLLRIFPYAGIKFMAYDTLERLVMPTPDQRTMPRLFFSGAVSGVISVLMTYPLELIRVRLAYQTKASDRTTLPQVIRLIANEKSSRNPLQPFYRGFSITILGMIPYAGVSFLTYGTLKRHITRFDANPTTRDLAAGAIAGAVSQTASYPFEVVRRRMQVGGANGGLGVKWRDAVETVWLKKGWRGFFVGLSIGYVKVVPMTSISFATWQLLKRVMDV